METQYISLNMTPTGINPCFHISQYDVGRMLGFIVHSGGATVDLDTYTCTVEATRSDGTAITSAVATTDNIGTFEVTPTMSNKADKYRCQLVIVDENSKRIASLPFDMEVTKAAMDENSEAIEEDASLYQQYTEAVQGAIAEANANIQAEENARIAADELQKYYITPQMYGAKADGLTDDTTAINNAINSLSDGDTLFFPDGIYKITDTIVVAKNINIICNGEIVLYANKPAIKFIEVDHTRYYFRKIKKSSKNWDFVTTHANYSIGCVVQNCNWCSIVVDNIVNFTTGVMLYATELTNGNGYGGTTYNDVSIKSCDSFDGIDLMVDDGRAYVNANTVRQLYHEVHSWSGNTNNISGYIVRSISNLGGAGSNRYNNANVFRNLTLEDGGVGNSFSNLIFWGDYVRGYTIEVARVEVKKNNNYPILNDAIVVLHPTNQPQVIIRFSWNEIIGSAGGEVLRPTDFYYFDAISQLPNNLSTVNVVKDANGTNMPNNSTTEWGIINFNHGSYRIQIAYDRTNANEPMIRVLHIGDSWSDWRPLRNDNIKRVVITVTSTASASISIPDKTGYTPVSAIINGGAEYLIVINTNGTGRLYKSSSAGLELAPNTTVNLLVTYCRDKSSYNFN